MGDRDQVLSIEELINENCNLKSALTATKSLLDETRRESAKSKELYMHQKSAYNNLKSQNQETNTS